MRFFQLFRITATANQTKHDTGLKSTEAEKKRLVNVHAQMNAYADTDDNEFQGWHERAKIFDFPEKMIPSKALGQLASVLSDPLWYIIPVDLDIPAGETFTVALKCAGTGNSVRGVYEYEIIA